MRPLPFLFSTGFPTGLNGAVDRRGSRFHHQPVRILVPATVLLLVTGWIFAQSMDQPVVATLVAVLCLGAVCSDAMRRRTPAILPVVGLVVILAVLAGAMVLLLELPPRGSERLLIQLSLIAVLAPVVPLVYALTFGGKDTDL